MRHRRANRKNKTPQKTTTSMLPPKNKTFGVTSLQTFKRFGGLNRSSIDTESSVSSTSSTSTLSDVVLGSTDTESEGKSRTPSPSMKNTFRNVLNKLSDAQALSLINNNHSNENSNKIKTDSETENGENEENVPPTSMKKTTTRTTKLTHDAETRKIDFLNARVLIALTMFMISGPALIMVNNHILHQLNFGFPTMNASIGVLASALIISVGIKLGLISIRREIADMVDCTFFTKKIALIAFFQAVTLASGNQCYRYLNVSIIQMLKSFTPAITLMLFIAMQATKLSSHLALAIALLTIGTCITAFDVSDKNSSSSSSNSETHIEGNFSNIVWGLILVLTSDFTEAVKVALTHSLLHSAVVTHTTNKLDNTNKSIVAAIANKLEDASKINLQTNINTNNTNTNTNTNTSTNTNAKNINTNEDDETNANDGKDTKNTKNDSKNINSDGSGHNVVEIKQLTVFESLYYYCPITFVFLWFLTIASGEFASFMEDPDRNFIILFENKYVFIMAGILGFLVNVAGWLVTDVISGLYLKALGTFRNVLLVILAVCFFGESVTLIQSGGYFISILGFLYYSYMKTN